MRRLPEISEDLMARRLESIWQLIHDQTTHYVLLHSVGDVRPKLVCNFFSARFSFDSIKMKSKSWNMYTVGERRHRQIQERYSSAKTHPIFVFCAASYIRTKARQVRHSRSDRTTLNTVENLRWRVCRANRLCLFRSVHFVVGAFSILPFSSRAKIEELLIKFDSILCRIDNSPVGEIVCGERKMYNFYGCSLQ